MRLIIGAIALIYACKADPRPTPINKLERTCVQNILKQDSILGGIRNHQCEELSLAKTIENYTQALSILNFEDCPPDFYKAFKAHIAAWNEMAVFVHPENDLRGELHDLFDLIKAKDDTGEFDRKLKAIWDTWSEIEASQE